MLIRFSKILFIALLFLSASLQISAQTGKPEYSLKSKTAIYFESVGLVNITEIDESISVRLIYSTSDNFTGKILYENLKEAYLHPDAAKALVTAQRILKRKHPSYTLVVYDASRPISIQWKMWETVRGTSDNIYVANPVRGGGLHNYGVAVDISILDASGQPLPMGTEVDYFGIEAHITNEAELVRQGKITSEEWKNRLLLRQVMREGGFHTISSEWWHFNLCSRETAKQKYVLIK
ncbi:D-alanyl-D-alanine dipeptidase [termite gut metagenome]|uniref:D-alanyl-D-alanine dipeptidase n=1 Tax=termite gut metagenome TaxID=433724 RepID=A0A5J4SUR7_9ZZZZ